MTKKKPVPPRPPKGNKYALGCTTNGRPRTHDREQIARDMIEWAKQQDSINLCGFCCSREPPIAPSMLINWTKIDPDFCKAYEITKAFLGHRREVMLNEDRLHVKAYDLNAKTYDQFLKEEARQHAEFEANLKKAQDESDKENLVTLLKKATSGELSQK